MVKETTHDVCIFSQQPDGYRRAGITLNYGANENVQVTHEQLKALEKDTRIKVQALKTSEGNAAQSNLDTGSVLPTLALNLSDAPEELAHIIAAIHTLGTDKKPTLEQLVFTVDGIEGEQKPSVAERDAAWLWYKENRVSTEQ